MLRRSGIQGHSIHNLFVNFVNKVTFEQGHEALPSIRGTAPAPSSKIKNGS